MKSFENFIVKTLTEIRENKPIFRLGIQLIKFINDVENIDAYYADFTDSSLKIYSKIYDEYLISISLSHQLIEIIIYHSLNQNYPTLKEFLLYVFDSKIISFYINEDEILDYIYDLNIKNYEKFIKSQTINNFNI